MDARRSAALQLSIDNGQLRAKVSAKAAKAQRQWKKNPSKQGKGKCASVAALPLPAAGGGGEPPVVAGIDFGKVICGSRNDEEGDGSMFFSDQYLDAPAVPGAREGVAQLVEALGARRVFVVSKARQRGRRRTLEWLAHHDFYNATGLVPYHVFFCDHKEDKAAICAALGVTAFVDDSVDVLAARPRHHDLGLIFQVSLPDSNEPLCM